MGDVYLNFLFFNFFFQFSFSCNCLSLVLAHNFHLIMPTFEWILDTLNAYTMCLNLVSYFKELIFISSNLKKLGRSALSYWCFFPFPFSSLPSFLCLSSSSKAYLYLCTMCSYFAGGGSLYTSSAACLFKLYIANISVSLCGYID